VDLNPSSALGEGCNIVDIFNTGFMVIMKKVFDIDVDADICWWHPMSPKVISKIGVVEWEEEEVDIASNEHVITHAFDAKTGKTVTAVEAAQTAGLCPGNSDDLTKYTD
jgi:hypothetical protein